MTRYINEMIRLLVALVAWHHTRRCFAVRAQMRLYVPEVVSVQRTSCNDELPTPPDVCPSTAMTMLPANDALDVAKDSCDEMQYASEEDWTLAADEITVIKD